MLEALHLTLFTWEEECLRVFLAMSFGFVLGWDRDSKNKPIDFRAYMIVCVATCLIAMATQELYADFANSENLLSLDLGKIFSALSLLDILNSCIPPTFIIGIRVIAITIIPIPPSH